MKVDCEIEEVMLEDDHGKMVIGVQARCNRCDHETQAYGTGEKSRKRCLALMRDECPQGEDNWYVDQDADSGGESRLPDPIVRPWWEKGRNP